MKHGPNRTYVEMYIETEKYDYLLNYSSYYIELLRNAYQYLCEHPEKVEEIVKQRVLAGKFVTKNNSFEWLLLELQIINTWILDEQFSGDIILTIPVSPKPFKPLIPINPATYSNKTNPIYIPKNVQHRKKGRR